VGQRLYTPAATMGPGSMAGMGRGALQGQLDCAGFSYGRWLGPGVPALKNFPPWNHRGRGVPTACGLLLWLSGLQSLQSDKT